MLEKVLNSLWKIVKDFHEMYFPSPQTDLKKYDREINFLSTQYLEDHKDCVTTAESYELYEELRRKYQAVNLKYGVDPTNL